MNLFARIDAETASDPEWMQLCDIADEMDAVARPQETPA